MRANFQLAFEVVGLLAFGAMLLAPSFILAKDPKLNAEKERKIELRKDRFVEKIKQPKANGDKSTNEVWITGREFPIMFQRRTVVKPVKTQGNK